MKKKPEKFKKLKLRRWKRSCPSKRAEYLWVTENEAHRSAKGVQHANRVRILNAGGEVLNAQHTFKSGWLTPIVGVLESGL